MREVIFKGCNFLINVDLKHGRKLGLFHYDSSVHLYLIRYFFVCYLYVNIPFLLSGLSFSLLDPAYVSLFCFFPLFNLKVAVLFLVIDDTPCRVLLLREVDLRVDVESDHLVEIMPPILQVFAWQFSHVLGEMPHRYVAFCHRVSPDRLI